MPFLRVLFSVHVLQLLRSPSLKLEIEGSVEMEL